MKCNSCNVDLITHGIRVVTTEHTQKLIAKGKVWHNGSSVLYNFYCSECQTNLIDQETEIKAYLIKEKLS